MVTCKLSGAMGTGQPGTKERCIGAFLGEGCGKVLRLTKFGRLPTHKRETTNAQLGNTEATFSTRLMAYWRQLRTLVVQAKAKRSKKISKGR